MEPDPAAAETPSPPPSPSLPASPPLEPPGDEHEGGAVEPGADPASPDRCVPVGDLNPGPQPSPPAATPPPPPPQQIGGEDAAGSSEVVHEKDSVAEVGEARRSFMEEFGDEGVECLIQSPKLKNIASPDCPAVLRFLGKKYNNLLEKYKKQSSKCADECLPKYESLKKKYTDECTERRRLTNELIELKGNIRVFCRCRPLNADEVTRGCSSVVEIHPLCETELQFLPSEKERKAFRFDHVFGPKDSQEAVFAETVPVVRSVMDGFNVCIFAYGQTGTGKTFTMEGVPEKRGVNYRALEELFRMSVERSASVAYTFSVSILEVYNEQINDLLDDSSKKLEIKQSPDGTQDVPGLVDAPIYTIDGVWEKLKVGARNRSVGSTNANELSSRSHSFVRVTVRSEHLVTGQQSKSYMWLVDLAGSERCDKTGADGERLKESQYINKSLSALGDVMSALASKKNSHIPYRNSKLTHLLQSSLGGDCKTLMFVQISPSSNDSGETLSSLTYASRVRSVEQGPARKQADPVELLKLKQMTEKLRQAEKENEDLKRSLQLMELKYVSRENTFRLLNDKVRDAERTCRVYQQRNKELENELSNEKKAARGPGRSSRPPLVPMRQRQPPQGRNSNYLPPGPSRSRFNKGPTIQNKENIPVMGTKAHPGTDKEKAVGKARRVSLTPVMRQIPLQPKRRASMAILPSLSEQLSSVHAGKRASRLSYLQIPRSSIAFPGAPLGAAAHVPSYVTPNGREEKVRKIDEDNSSKNTIPNYKKKLETATAMASRRYFGYDPCDYYYTSPYQYTYPYYHHPASASSAGGFFPVAGEDDQYYRYQRHPAIYRNAGGFFPATRDVDPYYEPAPARRARGFFPAAGNVEPLTACAAARPEAGASRSLPIPVRFDGSDPDPQVARVPVKRAPSSDEAAVRLQAAARGFLARRAVRALIAVEREADEVTEKVAREAEALRGDARARIAVGEALMRLLLRLDAVRGAREYRRRVTRRVLALQDAVDALEDRPALGAEEVEDQAAETSTVETVAEENALATELLSAVEKNGVTETSVTMDVEGDRAAVEDAEPAPGGANLGDKSADENAEGEWEMVSEEPAAFVPVDRHAPQTQGPAGAETTTRPAVAGGADGGVDTKKLMEMVAALCEQSAQQCAMIGALAERVDALERTVRQVEDAERRRQRVKKLRKEGKGSNHIKCHSD